MSELRFSQAIRVLALFAAEGASTAMFLQGSYGGDWLPRFVSHNELDPAGKRILIASIVAGAVVASIPAAVLLFSARRRGDLDPSLEHLNRIGRLLTFTLVLWAVPPMLAWQGWVNRDLMFLATAGVLVVAFERAARVSIAAAAEMHLFGSRGEALVRRLPRWTPHLVVALGVVAYVLYMSRFTLLHHARRETASFDLAYFDTFFWNTLHGRPFYAPITHPRAGSYLAVHAEFAVYLLAPFYALRPGGDTLLVMQSVLLGSSAVPLYLFARRRLASDWLAALVALAFLLYPPLHGPNFCDFHFLTISAFPILWAVYFFDAQKNVLFWIAVASALLCREDVPLGGIASGLALVFAGYRVRTGAVLAIVSAVYMVVVKFVIMPSFGATTFLYIYEGLVAPGERGFSSVLRTLLTNPVFTFSKIFVPEKLPFVLHVFLPLAFLPLRYPRVWFLLFPGFFMTLLSTGYWPITQIRFQYVTHFTPYVFVAAVLVLEHLTAAAGPVARRAASAALAAGTFLATHQFGALQQNYFFSGSGKVSFEITEEERQRLAELKEIAKTVPKDATLAATERDGPHVTGREYLFTLKYDAQGADYLLYSYDGLWVGEARKIVSDALRSRQFGLHAERPGFVVLRKGAPADRNSELLRKLATAR